MVYRHQRRQPAFLDQRHADGGADTYILKRSRFFRRKLSKVIVDDKRLACAKLRHRATSEIGKVVVPHDVHSTPSGPVPAYRKPVLVWIHVRIGAAGDPEILAQHARGDFKNRIGIPASGRLLAERIQEEKPGLILPDGTLRAAALHGRPRTLRHLADQREVVR